MLILECIASGVRQNRKLEGAMQLESVATGHSNWKAMRGRISKTVTSSTSLKKFFLSKLRSTHRAATDTNR